MKKVACVLVTFNRIELLKRCIKGLRNQSFGGFDIIVVNNGSNDGTEEWLSSQADLIVINQDNVGGAGGFYSGMKKAYDNGYEWVWMMDDDGLPDKEELEFLLDGACKNNLDFVNALVCNIDDPNNLSFGLRHNGYLIFDTAEAKKYDIIKAINPFNGTLISRNLIENIGFIKKEMFIWGDEAEYTFRAQKVGYICSTITKAIHYHPKIKGKTCKVIPFWDKYDVNIKPADKSHIHYRNLGYLYKTYMPNKILSPLILYSIVFVRKFQFKELIKLWRSYWRGVHGNFNDTIK